MISCVVTGAALGIGRSIAERLIEDGMHVVGVDWNAGALEIAAAEIGSGFEPLHGDIGEWATHEHAADAAERAAPLRSWVNNAGIDIQGGAHEVTPEEIERGVASAPGWPDVWDGGSGAAHASRARRLDRQHRLDPGHARLPPLLRLPGCEGSRDHVLERSCSRLWSGRDSLQQRPAGIDRDPHDLLGAPP